MPSATTPEPQARPVDAVADAMGRPTGQLERHPSDGWVFAAPYPLSRDLIAAFHGLIRAVIPPEPVIPDVEVRIEQQVRRMLPYMQPLIAWGFTFALRALDLAPIWRGRALKRLRDLPQAEASALFGELAHSRLGPLGDLVAAARAAVLAPYYDLDELTEHVGYRPVPFMRQRVALRARLLAGGVATPADHIGPFSDAVRAAVAAAPETSPPDAPASLHAPIRAGAA